RSYRAGGAVGQVGRGGGGGTHVVEPGRMPQRHENLVAWQRADDLCVAMYGLTSLRFPTEERYGLTSQLRRASFSVAANIVEGFAFESPKERRRFLQIAAASLAEAGYCLHLANRLGYLQSDEATVFATRVKQVAAPLHGLIRQLKRE